MRVCAQSSQRSTWPPSAAVRQVSIADMTFNWPRLTWPSLAPRQPRHGRETCPRPPGEAEPWRRGQAGGDCSVGFMASRSSGLVTSRIVLTATRV